MSLASLPIAGTSAGVSDGNDHHGSIVADSVDQNVWKAGDTQLAVLASNERIRVGSCRDSIGGAFHYQAKAIFSVCVACAIPRLGGLGLFLGQAMKEKFGHESQSLFHSFDNGTAPSESAKRRSNLSSRSGSSSDTPKLSLGNDSNN